MLSLITRPWPWYVAGPLIGLIVPILLIIGNKSFGISSSLRHMCAACIPSKIPFFQYDWKKEVWNLFFVGGIFVGGALAITLLPHGSVTVHPQLAGELATYGITDYNNLVPTQLMNWQALLTPRGLLMMVGGGFLVGFGSRYAGGCTSGHAIMGLSTLQWPSLVAVISFMIGGFTMANLILPQILSL